jgi:hypothetical protein
MARLNLFAEELPGVPVTMPVLKIARFDDAAERREIAERFAQQRIIRAGRDAWAEIGKAGSFEQYKIIGAALLIGRDHALRATGLNAPHGRRYSLAFREWLTAHGFGGMANTTRKRIVTLTENAAAIEAWRSTLPQRERNRIGNAEHMVRGWQASLNTRHGKCLAYVRRDAIAGWKKFLACVAQLPADQAAPLWAMVYQTKAVADAA